MRAIIIGAGRGRRLMPTTENAPKCFAEIQGRRILDWTVDALKAGGVTEVCFIGGYLIEAVRREYPDFIFRNNTEWETNNILVSLMYAEDLMDRPFVTAYSDILFTRDVVAGLIGPDNRIEYGVVGDAVNLASRVEALTREMQATILVSRNISEQLGPAFTLGRTATMVVKGKSQPVEVVEVLSLCQPVDSSAPP